MSNILTSQSYETVLPQIDSVLSTLEAYARTPDQHAFISFIESIDWAEYPPQLIIRAIDLALSLELTVLATDLAQKGRRLFPDSIPLQKAAQVLAAPIVQGTRPTRTRGQNRSLLWLRDHANQYHGKWIAVQAENLVGVADSLKALREIIGQQSSPEGILITRVL